MATDGDEALRSFREHLYGSFTSWGDALFELCDAVLCGVGPVSSIPSLSLEPEFSRSHGSLYKALRKGRINEDRLRRLLVVKRPVDWPAVFAVDASTWARCDAETSPGRGFYYSASTHSAGQPIVAGWSYQWISQLSWAPDSWTAPLDAMRVPPGSDATSATVEQIRRLVGLLPEEGEVPLFVLDAGYDPIAIGHDLAGARAEVLCRIRDDRVFYADPPPRPNRPPGSGGRPPRHGKRWKCSDPATWTTPPDSLVATDPRYGTVTVTAWHGVHPRLLCRGHWSTYQAPPIVKGSAIRVEVEHLPRPTVRTKKTLWLWWSGEGEPDLDRCWRAYLRRFDIEHGFRFVKGTLGWTTPSLCTPEQADRWTWLVVGALTQLRLARGIVADLRLSWERPRDPAQLTPARVRRGFRRLRATIGTPASPPKSTTPGPGRPKGTRKPPRTRYPAVKKGSLIRHQRFK
jgi:hypothetical protein